MKNVNAERDMIFERTETKIYEKRGTQIFEETRKEIIAEFWKIHVPALSKIISRSSENGFSGHSFYRLAKSSQRLGNFEVDAL